MIDFHTHSNFSDGALSPADLVTKAAGLGVRFLALTDHDTVDGLKQAADACLAQKITFVPGVELSVDYGMGELHLLGLNLGQPEKLKPRLSQLMERRRHRNLQIFEKIRADGHDISWETLTSMTDGPFLGRPHFAHALVNCGAASSVNEAFYRYLGTGMPYYAAKENLAFETAVELIRSGGGLAILAHPLSLGLNWDELDSELGRLASSGLLDGVEAYYGNYKTGQCKKLASLARKYRLGVSGGSDFHGPSKPGNILGRYARKRTIPSKCLSIIL